jgi:WXG100 family type VII secretion target
MGSKIQAQYAQLQSIKSKFEADEQRSQQILANITRAYEQVRQTWEGKGASAFFAEMEQDVIPRTKKMINAFSNAAQTTGVLISLFQEAAQEAANLFK